MYKPFFSIIIPCYNVEKVISTCIQSIVTQSFLGEYEILLVDDGSTDSTYTMLKTFSRQSGNIKVIKTEGANAGVARNIGISHATGKYLWFVDADDFLEPDSLSMIKEGLVEFNPDVFIFGYSLYQNRKNISRPMGDIDSTILEQVVTGKPISIEVEPSLLMLTGYPWNKIFLRKYILENKITFQDVVIHNDHRFFTESLLYSKNIVIDRNWRTTLHYVHTHQALQACSLTHLGGSIAFVVFSVLCETLSVVDQSKGKVFDRYLLAMSLINLRHRYRKLESKEQREKYEIEVVAFVVTNFSPEVIMGFSSVGHCSTAVRTWLFDLLLKYKRDFFEKYFRCNLNCLLTIVVTTYNLKNYLEETLSFLGKDLLELSQENYEVLIVDDCSTDGTQDIINSYEERFKNVRSIFFSKNTVGGVASAANAGIKSAKGKYLAFLDGDDLLAPDVLFEVLAKLEFFSADVCVADFNKFYEQSQKMTGSLEEKKWAFINDRIKFNDDKLLYMKRLALELNPVPWRKVYRTAFLHAENVYFPEVDFFHEDNPFHWFATTKTASLVFLQKILVTHRYEREGQTMSSFRELKGARAMCYHIELISSFLYTEEVFHLFSRQYANLVIRYLNIHKALIVQEPSILTKYKNLVLTTDVDNYLKKQRLPLFASSNENAENRTIVVTKEKICYKDKVLTAAELATQVENKIIDTVNDLKITRPHLSFVISPCFRILSSCYYGLKYARRSRLSRSRGVGKC